MGNLKFKTLSYTECSLNLVHNYPAKVTQVSTLRLKDASL